MFIDAYSRAIMGWAISLRPSTAEVLAALRDGMLLAEPAGAAWEVSRSGCGSITASSSAPRRSAPARWRSASSFSLATTYTPEEKGKIERLHLTLRADVPERPAALHRRPARPPAAGCRPTAPLALEQFVGLFADWVPDYNQRAHSELSGAEPGRRVRG